MIYSKWKWLPGLLAAAVILLFVFSAIAALLTYSADFNLLVLWQDPYYRHVTLFSFYQAFLSTLLSVVFAIPVAHALFRRDFFAKSLLLKFFAITLVLPVLVGIFGLLAVYGNSGLIAQLFESFKQKSPFSIYGLSGILLAHIFFNLPFAARLLLQSLQSIPAEHHKLSIHLGINHWQKFKLVEWPYLRQQLPHVCGLVFMLCFTSFTIVMALGGGPHATTIELAIYQAIKFDFDLQSGALLALWQILLCAGLVIGIQRFSRPIAVSDNHILQSFAQINDTLRAKIWDGCWISLAILLVLPPLLMVIISGINAQFFHVISELVFWASLKNSLLIAVLAAFIALFLGFFILLSSRCWRLMGLTFRADNLELIATIILVTPGLVISTGIFLLLRDVMDVFDFAIVIVVGVNALMALPYVIKTLAQPMLHIAQQYDQLCASLGLFGFARFRLVEWRAIKQPITHAFAISFVLSMGDLSAVALFGSQELSTLPLYLFQLLGSYQMQSAAVVSLFLLIFSLGIFVIIEKLLLKKFFRYAQLKQIFYKQG